MARGTSLFLMLATAAAWGATRPPVTYILDYGKNHLDQAGYVELVAGSPPQILHFGKDVPMTHNWGPIATMGGENVAFGKGEDIRRISPDELAVRVSRLQDMNQRLHRAGVSLVLPYICLMTIAGDETRRTGFWEFYDHWDDYAAFGLGPRPVDPAQWMQRTAEGGLKRFYTYGSGYYPGYETNHRYAASILHPGWRQWQRAVVRLAAKAGFDGLFVDNGGSFQSWDPLAQEGFRKWLAGRFEPARLKELFGLASAAEASLPERPTGPLGAEALRFWQTSIREFLAEMRREGSEVLGRRFVIFPNGAHNPVTLRYAHPDADYTMYELSMGSLGTTNTGRLTETVVEDVSFRHYLGHRYAYAYPVAMGGQARALVLTRPGYPRRRSEYEMNPAAARLGMAEAAAFGGGGGYLLPPDWSLLGEAMVRSRRFFETESRLFEGWEPEGRLGVLAFVDEVLFGNPQHLSAAAAAYEAATASALPTVLVTEERCTSEGLAGLAAVVVPAIRRLSEPQVTALEAAAARGTAIYVAGEPPRQDEWGRPSARAEALLGRAGVQKVGSPQFVATDAALDPIRLLARPVPPGLALAVYRLPGTPRRVLHLVNYNVDLGAGVERVDSIEGLRLCPQADWQVRNVRVHSPDWPASRAASLSQSLVALPPLEIYQVIELSGD